MTITITFCSLSVTQALHYTFNIRRPNTFSTVLYVSLYGTVSGTDCTSARWTGCGCSLGQVAIWTFAWGYGVRTREVRAAGLDSELKPGLPARSNRFTCPKNPNSKHVRFMSLSTTRHTKHWHCRTEIPAFRLQ
jgi:hypothetical protein